ncbi:glutathione S-transferase family protein [Thalassotalea litorea]|uniref:glutathione S-transferase family protein n=1 Tax=Thalassotalea litorea TaxID=2020715 RepID=UPI0037369051
MGLLVEGQWQEQWYDTKASGGKFERKASSFRHWLTADGSPGPNGQKGFKAEPNRYHLYVSLACPWAHRTLIFRKLKALEGMISVSVVHYLMQENGWTFTPIEHSDHPDWINVEDEINHQEFLHQVYTMADPQYTGRVTVPVLWDKKTKIIVSNESSEIIRMLNVAFDHLGARPWDFYPESLQEEIDTINDFVYRNINNGVYRAGFATTQQAYDEAVQELFVALDSLEQRLGKQRYLVGDSITEADWRLFTTLVRFDAVYVGHFKCNLRRLDNYPNLSGYLRELYQVPGVASTVNMTHIKRHYYQSHDMINPTGVVPQGPIVDFTQPHCRG